MSYSIPKGVFDILPYPLNEESKWKESHLWSYLQNNIRILAHRYGYNEVSTPIFEKTDLFCRSVGTDTDIVNKEMYTFEDKGKRSLSLRPEGTAPVMRAFIEKKLYNLASSHKFFYIGPMFRYERQQAGRYRQHHQFGLEALGSESALLDAEVIDILFTLYQELGLKNLKVYVNSVGDKQCRDLYKKSLKDYLRPHLTNLSQDSQKRFEANPLRILDSKDKNDIELLKKAPSILDFLEDDSKEHFDILLHSLTLLKIPFEIEPRLVRGLDYYNRTVFEIVSGNLGAQNTIGAGGRYDTLVENLGGPSTPAVGFGTGLERIIQTLIAQNAPLPIPNPPKVHLISLGNKAQVTCFALLKEIRFHKIPSSMDLESKKLKQALKYADKLQCPFVLILGEDELDNGVIELKDMRAHKSQKVKLDQLISKLKELIHA